MLQHRLNCASLAGVIAVNRFFGWDEEAFQAAMGGK
jgi:hypothetical protein